MKYCQHIVSAITLQYLNCVKNGIQYKLISIATFRVNLPSGELMCCQIIIWTVATTAAYVSNSGFFCCKTSYFILEPALVTKSCFSCFSQESLRECNENFKNSDAKKVGSASVWPKVGMNERASYAYIPVASNTSDRTFHEWQSI